MGQSLAMEIPQEAIRDAVAAVIVTMLGDNRDETLRQMIGGVLEAKGSYGRKEFENMVLDGIRVRAKEIINEMLSEDDVKEMIRQSLQTHLDGFLDAFMEKFTLDLTQKLSRSY